MRIREQILACIDSLLHPLVLLDILPLKTETAIKLIADVTVESGKTVREAVLVFIAALRYLSCGSGWDQEFIRSNAHRLSEIAIKRRVQANSPGRALPLLEILVKEVAEGEIYVIELGAAAGTIGRVLLNPHAVIANIDRYFPPGQQLPVEFRPVFRYLGLDLDPPDERWMLACVWDGSQRKQLEYFLHDIENGDALQLKKADAFKFPELEAVHDMAAEAAPGKLWVITSFMFYQYRTFQQQQLSSIIERFIQRYNGHWLNQRYVGPDNEYPYEIQLDGETVIRLTDDLCRSWQWI